MKTKHTQEQSAIMALCAKGNSVWADAGAGCGKTFLADAVSLAHAKAGKPVKQLVFMRALADSQKAKHAENPLISAQTLHSFGYGMLLRAGIIRQVLRTTKNGKKYRAFNVSNGIEKVQKHLQQVILDQYAGDDEIPKLERAIVQLVSLAKTEGVFLPVEAVPTMEDVATKHGLNDPMVIEIALKVLERSDKDHEEIDQSDMIRLPVLNKLRSFVEKGTLVVVDECQDYNLAMASMLVECIAPQGTQVLLVGDKDHQALMQFTGARPELTDYMASVYNCERMPLTVNFRCSKAVLRNACGRPLQPRPDAPEGEVGTVGKHAFLQDVETGIIADGCAVLCEANAPLIQLGLTLLSKGIPVQMRAEKLEGYVRSFCYRWVSGAFDIRKVKIGGLSEKIQKAFRETEQAGGEIPAEDKEMAGCIQAIEIFCLSQGLTESRYNVGTRSYEHPIQIALHRLLTGTNGVTLSTGHTSKGLEWERVYHYPGKVKVPELAWQEHQAFCLDHVIQTRAKIGFYTVSEIEQAA